MIHIKQKNNRQRLWISILSPVLITAAGLYLLYAGVGAVSRRTQEEQLAVLTQAVRRATVQCYAIENRYPPSVEYLEEHYGLSIDRGKYHVFYDGWASNIMPEITIIPAGEEALAWH